MTLIDAYRLAPSPSFPQKFESNAVVTTPGSSWITENRGGSSGGSVRNNNTTTNVETYTITVPAGGAKVYVSIIKFNSASQSVGISIDGGAEVSIGSMRNASVIEPGPLVLIGTLSAGVHTIAMRSITSGSFEFILFDYFEFQAP